VKCKAEKLLPFSRYVLCICLLFINEFRGLVRRAILGRDDHETRAARFADHSSDGPTTDVSPTRISY